MTFVVLSDHITPWLWGKVEIGFQGLHPWIIGFQKYMRKYGDQGNFIVKISTGRIRRLRLKTLVELPHLNWKGRWGFWSYNLRSWQKSFEKKAPQLWMWRISRKLIPCRGRNFVTQIFRIVWTELKLNAGLYGVHMFLHIIHPNFCVRRLLPKISSHWMVSVFFEVYKWTSHKVNKLRWSWDLVWEVPWDKVQEPYLDRWQASNLWD